MKKGGRLIVITGPMFSGKTTRLLKEVQKASKANQKAILFKSSIDNRYSTHEVVSHDGIKMTAAVLPAGDEFKGVLDDAAQNYDIIAIDEGQFWRDTVGFAEALNNLAFKSKRVYVATLNTKADGKPFGVAKELIPLADTVYCLWAKCSRCGKKANFTQRVIKGSEDFSDDFLVGGKESYEARCRKCFVRKKS